MVDLSIIDRSFTEAKKKRKEKGSDLTASEARSVRKKVQREEEAQQSLPTESTQPRQEVPVGTAVGGGTIVQDTQTGEQKVVEQSVDPQVSDREQALLAESRRQERRPSMSQQEQELISREQEPLSREQQIETIPNQASELTFRQEALRELKELFRVDVEGVTQQNLRDFERKKGLPEGSLKSFKDTFTGIEFTEEVGGFSQQLTTTREVIGGISTQEGEELFLSEPVLFTPAQDIVDTTDTGAKIITTPAGEQFVTQEEGREVTFIETKGLPSFGQEIISTSEESLKQFSEALSEKESVLALPDKLVQATGLDVEARGGKGEVARFISQPASGLANFVGNLIINPLSTAEALIQLPTSAVTGKFVDVNLQQLSAEDFREGRAVTVETLTREEREEKFVQTLALLFGARRGIGDLTLKTRAVLGSTGANVVLKLKREAIRTGEPQTQVIQRTKGLKPEDDIVAGIDDASSIAVTVTPAGKTFITEISGQKLVKSKPQADLFEASGELKSFRGTLIGKEARPFRLAPFSKTDLLDISGRTIPETGVVRIEQGQVIREGRLFSRTEEITPFEVRPRVSEPSRFSADEILVSAETPSGVSTFLLDINKPLTNEPSLEVSLSRTQAQQFRDVTLGKETAVGVADTLLGRAEITSKSLVVGTETRGIGQIDVSQQQFGFRPREQAIIDVVQKQKTGKKKQPAIIETIGEQGLEKVEVVDLPETLSESQLSFSTRAGESVLFGKALSRERIRFIQKVEGEQTIQSQVEGFRATEPTSVIQGRGVSESKIIKDQRKVLEEGFELLPDIREGTLRVVKIEKPPVPTPSKPTRSIASIFEDRDVQQAPPKPTEVEVKSNTGVSQQLRVKERTSESLRPPKNILNPEVLRKTSEELTLRQQARGGGQVSAGILESIANTIGSRSKTRQSISPKVRGELAPRIAERQELRLNQKPLTAERLVEKQSNVILQRNVQQERNQQKEQQKQIQRNIQRQVQRQQEKQIQRNIQKVTGGITTSPPINQVPPTPIISPPIIGGFTIPEKRSRRKQEGFNTEVKVKGKFIKANKDPLSKSQASNLGRVVTDKTSSRTFRIKPAGKPAVPKRIKTRVSKDKFRPSKTVKGGVVEKSKFAIDSPTEKEQITAKGLRAVARKSTVSRKKSKRRQPLSRLGIRL